MANDHHGAGGDGRDEEPRAGDDPETGDAPTPSDRAAAAPNRPDAVPDSVSGELDLPEPVLRVVESPTEGRHRLPFLLGLLDGDDPRERLAATTAVCVVVDTHPDLLAYVVGRLVDRLGPEAPVEVAHALDYLAARHPRAVDEAVSDLDEAEEERARQRMYRTGAGFARSEYLSPTVGGRAIGRARIAGDDPGGDPRRVYTSDGDERREESDGDEDAETAEDSDGDSGGAEDDTGENGTDDAADEDERDRNDGGHGVTSGTLQLVSRRLSTVVERSRFDDLAVLSERRRGRFGDVYRTAGRIDGDERAVALTVYRLPDADREAFVRGVSAAMSDWTAVDDHEGVQTVYDWGVQPRPWAALDHAGVTLADRDIDPRDPLSTVRRIVEAVGHAHQHGVVHGALDPGTVAYRDDVLTEGASRQPLVTNLGLAAATGLAQPGRGVDPRYAAPEHYDERFGRIDHATDVYGLGALLYRLTTGEHPYDGDPETVRERVVSDDSLEPTRVDPALPAALNDVVRKATAPRKLTRYETVTNLAGELRSLTDGT